MNNLDCSNSVADCSAVPVLDCCVCFDPFKVSFNNLKCNNPHTTYLCNGCYKDMVLHNSKKCPTCRGALKLPKKGRPAIPAVKHSRYFEGCMERFYNEYIRIKTENDGNEDFIPDEKRIMLGVAECLINIFKQGDNEADCLKRCFITSVSYEDANIDTGFTEVLFNADEFLRDEEGFINLTGDTHLYLNVIYRDDYNDYLHYQLAFYTLHEARDAVQDQQADNFYCWADTHEINTWEVVVNSGFTGTMKIALEQSENFMNEMETLFNNESDYYEHTQDIDRYAMIDWVFDNDYYAEIIGYRWSEYCPMDSSFEGSKIRAKKTDDTREIYLLIGSSCDDRNYIGNWEESIIIKEAVEAEGGDKIEDYYSIEEKVEKEE